MKKIIPIIAFMAMALPAKAFVLMGPSDPTNTPLNLPTQLGPVNELTLQWPGSSGVTSANVSDFLYGTPKDKFRFYRLNTPHLTYGFDETFVQYFGAEGVVAIDEAMRVINDFFIPEDGSYKGMSQLDLIKHGFSGNFATWWRNQTAANQNLIDLKSLTLGLVVNRLGLGNPHRYAFTAYGVDTSTTATTFQAIFRTKLNNYDPITLEQTDRINDIQYSYRLIHDQPAGTQVTAGNISNMTMDMEEFTSSIEDNTYSAVAAIQDAFYGNTEIVWTQPPSKFGFGIYYDGLNAMGGMYKPRHALTYDDAGGLKYLYNKDNVVMEYNPWQALKLADFSEVVKKYANDLPISQDPFINLKAGVFPIRTRSLANAAQVVPSPTALDPLQYFRDPMTALPGMQIVDVTGTLVPVTIEFFSNGDGFVATAAAQNPQKIDWAYRGGIETITIHKMEYDSLLDSTPEPKAFQWNDVFMTNLAIRASQGGTAPGTTSQIKPAPAMYFTQVVNRVVSQPDFLFFAAPLGQSQAGTPIAYIEELGGGAATGQQWFMTSAAGNAGGPSGGSQPVPVRGGNANHFHNFGGDSNLGPNAAWQYATGLQTIMATGNGTANPQIGMPFGAAVSGPGIWAPAADWSSMQIQFNNEFNMGGFEVIWSGETTVLGNTNAVTISQQNWAHIQGPGPLDFKKFPDRIDNQAASYYREWENTIYPSTGIPDITAVSDNGGVTLTLESLARTSENLTIMGNHFRNAVALEVVNEQGAAVETIYPIASFVKSNNLIEVPYGTFSDSAEGDLRRIQIWTTETVSKPSDDSFTIHTGPVIITATSHDGKAYDRNDLLTVHGQGFKSLGYTGFAIDNLGNMGKGSIAADGNMTASHVRLLTSTGEAHWPLSGDEHASYGLDRSRYISVISDQKLVISGGAFPQEADGVDIYLTISRGNNPTLSAMPSLALGYVTTTPEITGLHRGLTAIPGLNDINATAPLHRDKDVTIKGFGLNTVRKIEFIRESGLSYTPPVTVDLNSLNWTASNNGTDARITANAITQSDADGFGAYRSKMKITTEMGDVIYPIPFNLNKKPDTTLTVGGLTGSATDPAIPYNGSLGLVWDYMGTDKIVLQNGGGMRAVKYIRIAPVTGSWFLPVREDRGGTKIVPTLTINDAPGTTPGVTVTDTSITLDTRLINFVNIDKAAVSLTVTEGWRKFILVCEDNSTVSGSDTTSGISVAPWNINNDPTLMPGHSDIETTVNVLIGRYPVITDATAGFNRYKTTSASSVAIGTGNKIFEVDTGLSFKRGELVKASSVSSAANLMIGRVVSYEDGEAPHKKLPIFDPTPNNGVVDTLPPTLAVGGGGRSLFNIGLGHPFKRLDNVSATDGAGNITGTVEAYRGFETRSSTRVTLPLLAAPNGQQTEFFCALGPRENTDNQFTFRSARPGVGADIVYIRDSVTPDTLALKATVSSYNGHRTTSTYARGIVDSTAGQPGGTVAMTFTGVPNGIVDWPAASTRDLVRFSHTGRPDRYIVLRDVTYNGGAGTLAGTVVDTDDLPAPAGGGTSPGDGIGVSDGMDLATAPEQVTVPAFEYFAPNGARDVTFNNIAAVGGLPLTYFADAAGINGDMIEIVEAGTAANFMRGRVKTWDPNTGELKVAVTDGGGAAGVVPAGRTWIISQWTDSWDVEGNGRLVVTSVDDTDNRISPGLVSDSWNITGDGILQVTTVEAGVAAGLDPWPWVVKADGALTINVDPLDNGATAGSGTFTAWNLDLSVGSAFNLARSPYWNNNNYYNNATIIGTGLNYVTRVEIADDTGLALTGLNSGNNASIRIPEPDKPSHGSWVDFNATYLPPTVATRISDTVLNKRRIRVITPFGSSYSVPPVVDPNAAEAFTISATPSLSGSPIIAYSGTYGIAPATAGDVPSYDSQNNLTTARMPLIIGGSNFGGVRKIEFLDHNMRVSPILTLTVDPKNSPVALFNANFDTITIPATWMDTNATWTSPDELSHPWNSTWERMRSVRLTMVHGEVLDLPRFEANATYDQ